MKIDDLAVIRKAAVYFVCGKWPEIVQADIPKLDRRKRWAFIILELED